MSDSGVRGPLQSLLQGKYLEIAQQNQLQSPLLKLPSEIRTAIFEYVFGDEVLRYTYPDLRHNRIHPLTYNNIELLRVCRQIYAEMRLLPLMHSTFIYGDRIFQYFENELTLEQRGAIRRIQLKALPNQWLDIETKDPNYMTSVLPGLKHVHILIWWDEDWNHNLKECTREDTAKEFEDAVKEKFSSHGKSVVVTHEFTKEDPALAPWSIR